jgi:hypothetical protein
MILTRPGVGVSSQRFLRPGVAPSARPGVASHRLPAPGVWSQRPGVASVAGPGVASHRLTEGVASTASQSDTFAFFLQHHQQGFVNMFAASSTELLPDDGMCHSAGSGMLLIAARHPWRTCAPCKSVIWLCDSDALSGCILVPAVAPLLADRHGRSWLRHAGRFGRLASVQGLLRQLLLLLLLVDDVLQQAMEGSERQRHICSAPLSGRHHVTEGHMRVHGVCAG